MVLGSFKSPQSWILVYWKQSVLFYKLKIKLKLKLKIIAYLPHSLANFLKNCTALSFFANSFWEKPFLFYGRSISLLILLLFIGIPKDQQMYKNSFGCDDIGFCGLCNLAISLLLLLSIGIPRDQRMYKNSLDCLIKILKSEGLFGLYKGFIPNWMRLGPHTIISFFLFEYLRKIGGMRPV